MGKENNTKDRIIKAAWELFYVKGYENTTVDDIIANSSSSKGSFYYYFDSKDSLLSTLSSILDEKYEVLQLHMDTEMNSFEKLMYINYEAHKLMEDNIECELLSSLYSSQLITKSDVHLLDQNRTYYKLLKEIVVEGQARKEISSDKSAEEVCKFYSMCERALVSDWCLSNGNYSLASYSKEYMPIFMEHFRVSPK